jgi:hypothetical protein
MEVEPEPPRWLVSALVINGDRSAINRYHRGGFDPEMAASSLPPTVCE